MNEMQKEFLRKGRVEGSGTEFGVLNEFGDLFECESLGEANNIAKNNRNSTILQRDVTPWREIP